MDDATFEPLGGASTAGVRGTDLLAHVFDHPKELSVLRLARLLWRLLHGYGCDGDVAQFRFYGLDIDGFHLCKFKFVTPGI